MVMPLQCLTNTIAPTCPPSIPIAPSKIRGLKTKPKKTVYGVHVIYRLTGIVGTTGRGNPTQPSATNAQKNITGMEKRFLKSKVIQLGYMASTNHYHGN